MVTTGAIYLTIVIYMIISLTKAKDRGQGVKPNKTFRGNTICAF